jgi:putative FmdB family regulatory protein
LLAFGCVPIYEYKCPKGHVFELFQKMSDEPPAVCEVCGEGPLQRVLYPVAVHFKGSGFYSTDYGKGGTSKKPSRDGDKSERSEKSEKSGDSSSEKGEKKEKNVKKVAES